MRKDGVQSGCLYKYMSRVVLVIEKLDADWYLCQEIGEDELMFKKIRECVLTTLVCNPTVRI